MSAGANQGGNLNIFVLEVGIVTTDDATGIEVVSTVSVHPMIVVPKSIRYQDATRSPVMETTGGAILTRAGRALRNCSFDGVFGVETRGIGGYIGNGEIRFQRFYKEVVRMSDALTSDDVQAAVDILNGTPFISLLVKPFVDGKSTIYVNWYDFWNKISFQCLVQSFNFSREARNGGATGNISYAAVLKEIGPVKTGGLGNTILSALLSILGTWDSLNNVIASYNAEALLESVAGVAAIFVSELADQVEAIGEQVQAVQALMGANSASSLESLATNNGIVSFFASLQRLTDKCAETSEAILQMMGSRELDDEGGAVAWDDVEGEGDNRLLRLFEFVAGIEELADSARFNMSAGKFFGMDRLTYQAYILGGGVMGLTAPEIAGTSLYEVSISDTPESISVRFGVAWATILDVNDMTPDEALFPGAVLKIPVRRVRGPVGNSGLPTFGSHQGEDAWGVDWPLELVARDGALLTVSGEDVLAQGAAFIEESSADGLLKDVQNVADAAKADYIGQRLAALYQLDGRFTGNQSISVTLSPDGTIDVESTLYAINGGELTTGERA